MLLLASLAFRPISAYSSTHHQVLGDAAAPPSRLQKLQEMRALGLSVVVLALAVGVAHHQGHIDATSAEQWRAAPGRLLAQPAVAATVDRLRAAAPGWLLDLLPASKAGSSCACGVSTPLCVMGGAAGGMGWAACAPPPRLAHAVAACCLPSRVPVGGAGLACHEPLLKSMHPLQNVTEAAAEEAACNLAGNVTDCCESFLLAAWPRARLAGPGLAGVWCCALSRRPCAPLPSLTCPDPPSHATGCRSPIAPSMHLLVHPQAARMRRWSA